MRPQANILEHVTADFPPAFISDGNTATYGGQASGMNNELGRGFSTVDA